MEHVAVRLLRVLNSRFGSVGVILSYPARQASLDQKLSLPSVDLAEVARLVGSLGICNFLCRAHNQRALLHVGLLKWRCCEHREVGSLFPVALQPKVYRVSCFRITNRERLPLAKRVAQKEHFRSQPSWTFSQPRVAPARRWSNSPTDGFECPPLREGAEPI